MSTRNLSRPRIFFVVLLIGSGIVCGCATGPRGMLSSVWGPDRITVRERASKLAFWSRADKDDSTELEASEKIAGDREDGTSENRSKGILSRFRIASSKKEKNEVAADEERKPEESQEKKRGKRFLSFLRRKPKDATDDSKNDPFLSEKVQQSEHLALSATSPKGDTGSSRKKAEFNPIDPALNPFENGNESLKTAIVKTDDKGIQKLVDDSDPFADEFDTQMDRLRAALKDDLEESNKQREQRSKKIDRQLAESANESKNTPTNEFSFAEQKPARESFSPLEQPIATQNRTNSQPIESNNQRRPANAAGRFQWVGKGERVAAESQRYTDSSPDHRPVRSSSTSRYTGGGQTGMIVESDSLPPRFADHEWQPLRKKADMIAEEPTENWRGELPRFSLPKPKEDKLPTTSDSREPAEAAANLGMSVDPQVTKASAHRTADAWDHQINELPKFALHKATELVDQPLMFPPVPGSPSRDESFSAPAPPIDDFDEALAIDPFLNFDADSFLAENNKESELTADSKSAEEPEAFLGGGPSPLIVLGLAIAAACLIGFRAHHRRKVSSTS